MVHMSRTCDAADEPSNVLAHMRQVFGATLATASGVTNAQCGMCSDLLDGPH